MSVGYKASGHKSSRRTEKPSCWRADCGALTSLRMFHLPAQAPKPVPYLSVDVTFHRVSSGGPDKGVHANLHTLVWRAEECALLDAQGSLLCVDVIGIVHFHLVIRDTLHDPPAEARTCRMASARKWRAAM